MSEIDELRLERETKHAIYIQFLAEYNRHKKEFCYGFVEGKDDPSFYRCHINKELPYSHKIRLFPAGNKKSVKDVYSCFDWRRFQKNRIVFFIDRDLSDIVEDNNLIEESNVYLTDNYSIENDIVNRDTFESVLREVLGFAMTDQESIDRVLELFEEQKEIFERLMMHTMANIIYWKRLRLPICNYRNINIKDVINISNGVVINLKGELEFREYIYRMSNVLYDRYNPQEVLLIHDELEQDSTYKKIIRGKYITTFFILFCNSIYRDCGSLNIERNNIGTLLGESDMMKVIAPRCRIPQSLKSFINNTLIQYAASLAVA